MDVYETLLLFSPLCLALYEVRAVECASDRNAGGGENWSHWDVEELDPCQIKLKSSSNVFLVLETLANLVASSS